MSLELECAHAEEKLAALEESFSKLRSGSLFTLNVPDGTRYFVAVEPKNDETWEVIELTDANRERIVRGEPCSRSTFYCEHAWGLAIIDYTSNFHGWLRFAHWTLKPD